MPISRITTAGALGSHPNPTPMAKRRTLFCLNPQMLRELLLVCVLPTSTVLCAVAVIAVERMQADPVGVPPERVMTSFAWLASALAFFMLHVAGSYVSMLNVLTAREHAQRWVALGFIICVGYLVLFGWPAGWSVPLPAVLDRALSVILGVIFAFLYIFMLPILILLPFAVAALTFAGLLALATAPDLFRRDTQAVVGRTFIAHLVVTPIALLVGTCGSVFAQTSFTLVGRIDGLADLLTASSTSGPYWPAAIALFSCAIVTTHPS